jgi:uncharacterized protein YjbI with pentapeptide repeats
MEQERNISRRPTRQQVLVALGLAILITATTGYVLGGKGTWPVENTGISNKVLWKWMDLLIVPATIAIVGIVGGALFTWERARDTALQTYLDKMSELLIDKCLRRETRRYGDTRLTARARTLAILSQLDGKRKRIVLQFLREARLINKDHGNLEGVTINPRLVGLREADLRRAKLRGIKLINHERTEPVSLEGAILKGADLRNADLEGADLQEADLSKARLKGACLKGVDLSCATLTGADLREIRLGIHQHKEEGNQQIITTHTNLRRADLRHANLRGATELTEDGQEQQVTTNWLEENTELLTGATMPNGMKHD